MDLVELKAYTNEYLKGLLRLNKIDINKISALSMEYSIYEKKSESSPILIDFLLRSQYKELRDLVVQIKSELESKELIQTLEQIKLLSVTKDVVR